MPDSKYEITEIAHEEYPFLHRIRALRDVGLDVKAGDLGGFVEREENLSQEDNAWIYDDAIAAGSATVDQDSQLRDWAVACESAYISQGSVMSGNARAEGSAFIRGAKLSESALASSHAMVLNDQEHPEWSPLVSGNCAVYGTVQGRIALEECYCVFSSEMIRNDTEDMFVINSQGRSVLRSEARDMLYPTKSEAEREEQASHPPVKESQPGKQTGKTRRSPKRTGKERQR